MNETKSGALENPMLSKIMAAYAEIWADVMLDKNLQTHLRNMEDDLKILNELIDGKELLGHNSLHFHRIANMLYRLKDIVLDKIGKSKNKFII